MTIEEIRAAIDQEFGTHARRFRFVELDLSTAVSPDRPRAGRGVHVFWNKEGGVVRDRCVAFAMIRLRNSSSSSLSLGTTTGLWLSRLTLTKRSSHSFQPTAHPDIAMRTEAGAIES